MRVWLPCVLIATTALAQQVDEAFAVMQRAVVQHHARWCHHIYAESLAHARQLQRAIEALLQAPDDKHLRQARSAWIKARRIYGQTEALRFHDGPIEALEPLLNAWPVDEAYIDYVEGRPDCGIVNSPDRFANLAGAALELANERGGEANICVGWHAIEFLLWGQDLSPTGPGNRPADDFREGIGRNADRRRMYLRTVTALLVQHLTQLRDAWAQGSKYRTQFERDTEKSVRRMLTGVTVLTAFEMCGERLSVAFETRAQEQEHSCFSDQTHTDLITNQLGLQQVLAGPTFADERGPGLLELIAMRDKPTADFLRASVSRAAKCLHAIPAPFDQAILAEDESAPRRALAAAIRALEEQTDALLIAGKQLGHDLPLQPGG